MLEQNLALFIVEVGDKGYELRLGRRGEVKGGGVGGEIHGESPSRPAYSWAGSNRNMPAV